MDASASLFSSPLLHPKDESILSIPIFTNFASLSIARHKVFRCTCRSSLSGSRVSSPVPSRCSVTNGEDRCHRHWMVLLESLPDTVTEVKPDVVNYYVKILAKVLGSEKDAQMSIYDASLDTQFGFCCDIDEGASRELASLEGVLLVTPDPSYDSHVKDYGGIAKSLSQLNNQVQWKQLFPHGTGRHWMVKISKPGVGVITKELMVDYCTDILRKVMGNEKDAQMCIYHVSWRSDFCFCCELDEECARKLAGNSGVLSVYPDTNYGSYDKDYGDRNDDSSAGMSLSSQENQSKPLKSRKLFVTGLSFYTSEQTLRTAFEVFGELVEVKVIIDKISKRSKGYAFIEYTTEEAASAALEEMNGKIINGWMIVVDVAKTNPSKYSRRRPRP